MSTPTINHRAPRQIIAGDSIEFLVSIPTGYETWTGAARLTGPDENAMAATSVATEGTDYHLKFAGAGSTVPNTGELEPGYYRLTVWAVDAANAGRKTIAQFPVYIGADLSTGAPDEPHSVKMLRYIEAELEARVTGHAIEEYDVEATRVKKATITELKRWRKDYAAEVAALNNPNGQIGRVKFSFTPAGGAVDIRRRFG